jgi:hypothetical protein
MKEHKGHLTKYENATLTKLKELVTGLKDTNTSVVNRDIGD